VPTLMINFVKMMTKAALTSHAFSFHQLELSVLKRDLALCCTRWILCWAQYFTTIGRDQGKLGLVFSGSTITKIYMQYYLVATLQKSSYVTGYS
jgi:hypothetical protein